MRYDDNPYQGLEPRQPRIPSSEEERMPYLPISDIDLDVSKVGHVFTLKVDIECAGVLKIYGAKKWDEADDFVTRHRIVRALSKSVARVIPSELRKEGLARRLVKQLNSVLTNENYLMKTVAFEIVEKRGCSMTFPPDGMFLDVTLVVKDEITFHLVGDGIRLVSKEDYRVSPGTTLAATKPVTADYGKIPAKQTKQGVSVIRNVCPKPGQSAHCAPVDKVDRCFCLYKAPKGHMPAEVECKGFGGIADGDTICRYVTKMTAKKSKDQSK